MQATRIFRILLIPLLFISSQLSARFFVPDTVKQFDDIMAQHDLAIVYFNPYGIGDVPEEDQDTVDNMKQDFVALGQEGRYQKANVAFIGVNTARMPKIATRFNIDPQAKATVILFKDGNEYKEAKRKTGYLTKGQMRSFVEKYFGDIIDRLIAKRKSSRQAVRYYGEPSYSTYYYPSDYYDYYDYDYYPYYGYYNYPYWGPGFGFSIGDGFGFGIGFGF